MSDRDFTITLDISEATMRRFVDVCRPIAAELDNSSSKLSRIVADKPDALTTGVMLLALHQGLALLEKSEQLPAIWCEMVSEMEAGSQ